MTYDTRGNPALELCCNRFWKYIFLFFLLHPRLLRNFQLPISRVVVHSLSHLVKGEIYFSAIFLPRKNRHLTVFPFNPKNHTQLVASFFLYFVSFFPSLLFKWPNCLASLTSNYIKYFFSSHFDPEK